MFYSEALHFAPGLVDYTYLSAKNAVEGIRETDYQSDDPKILLPILKTCQDVDDVREYLDGLPKKSKKAVNRLLISKFY